MHNYDNAAGSRDARHLGYALFRFAEIEDDERHQGCVEALSGKGKRHRIAFMKFGDASFVPATRKNNLFG